MSQQFEIPAFHEWLVLIQRDAERAVEYFARLQADISQKGAEHVSTAALMSRQGYHKAINLIELAASNVAKKEELIRETKLGLKMFGPYPDKKTWEDLISTDPLDARKTVHALKLKAASLGAEATEDLKQSISDYHNITGT